MNSRSYLQSVWAAALLLLCLLRTPRVQADPVQQSVIVHFDASSSPSERAHEVDQRIPEVLVPWQAWAAAGSVLHDLDTLPDYEVENWTNRTDHAGLEFHNTSHSLIRLRLLVRLPAGLWRADAALLVVADENKRGDGATVNLLPETPASAPWRMESLFLQTGTEATRALEVRPGTALFLRWAETGASALAARKAVRRSCWTTADSALQDRVAGALMPVDDIIDALPTLIAHGDRKKITTRIHTALLATAKAQALWDNGRGDSITDRDSAFTDLTVALSEVSCACFDLVPSQTIVLSSSTGKPELRVGVTNAGSRTIPLVTLGVENADGSASGSDRTVYRTVAPGATVTALFPLSDPALAHGVVQFLSDMGAATVSAAPTAPAMPPLAIPAGGGN